MNDYKKLIKETNYAREEIKDDNIENSAYYRWLNKKIEKEETIFSMNEASLSCITKPSCGKISTTKTDYLNEDKVLLLETNVDVENVRPRPSAGIVINLEKADKGIDISITVDL